MAGQTKPGGLGRIFIRKSIEQMHAEHEQGELKKTLGAWNLILLGIGCIIGTGIFVLTGRAAAEFAGPGIMISFVITGTLCALVALAYAVSDHCSFDRSPPKSGQPAGAPSSPSCALVALLFAPRGANTPPPLATPLSPLIQAKRSAQACIQPLVSRSSG
jgi:hypothetical protein